MAWLQVAWDILRKAGGITVPWEEDPSSTKVPSILIHLTLLSVKKFFLYKVLNLLLYSLWGGMMQNPSPSLFYHVHWVPPVPLPPNSAKSLHTWKYSWLPPSKIWTEMANDNWDNFVTSAQKQGGGLPIWSVNKTCYLPPTWLKDLLWLSWCALGIWCMSGSWVLSAFHSLALKTKHDLKTSTWTKVL